MYPYLITFFICILATYYADKLYDKKLLFLLLSLIAIGAPTILAGYRNDTIGTDVSVYAWHHFKYIQEYTDPIQYIMTSDIDLLFSACTAIGYAFTQEMYGILTCVELWIMLCVFVALTKLRNVMPMWQGMYLYLFLFYNQSLNIMRQHMAMAVGLLAFACLINKQYRSFIIASIVSAFCHKTSFIMFLPLFIYFLGNTKMDLSDRKCTSYTFMVFCCLFGFSYLVEFATRYGFIALATGSEAGSRLSTTIAIANIVFLYVGYKITSFECDNLHKNFPRLLTNIKFVLDFSTLVTVWASRITLYFSIFYVIVFPIEAHRSARNKRYMYILMAFVFLYWYVDVVLNGTGQTMPYHSDLLGI